MFASLITSPISHALGDDLFAVKVGGFVPALLKAATTSTGSAGFGNGPFPTLGIMKSIGSFELNFDATILGRSGTDDAYSGRWLLLQFPYVWKAGLDFRLGPLIAGEMISGAGGNIVLNNGGGTATFSKPGALRFALLVGLTGGIRVPIGDHFSLITDVMLTGALSTRRAVHILSSAAYAF